MTRFTFVALLTAALFAQTSTAQADVVTAINKSFQSPPNDPLTFTATGTFDFPPGTADIEGMISFSKMITLAPNSGPIDAQHVLIGEWDESWSLTKIGFQNPPGGGLTGFDPSVVSFGDTGTFDVDITMVGPVPPGHASRTDFTVDQPLTTMPIDDVIPLLEMLALSNDGVQAVIDAIVPGASGVVPVSVTSLHIPEPASATLLLLGMIATLFRRARFPASAL